MKVLAKLGLVTAAAATVLFIFIYEFQGPVINRVMSQPPVVVNPVEPIEKVQELNTESANEVELPKLEAEVPVEEEEPEPEVVEPVVEKVAAPPATIEEEKPTGPTRRIYGKITLSTSGELLSGVNIMVPGSTVAKASNPNGGYTIEVPINTRELVFIYRGKKLVKRLDSENSLVNVALNLDSMQYD